MMPVGDVYGDGLNGSRFPGTYVLLTQGATLAWRLTALALGRARIRPCHGLNV